MYLRQLCLSNFRNYDSVSLDLSPNINIFYGDNAQGKTNLLEAVYFLGITKSHRNSNIDSLIKSGKESSFVSGKLINNDQTQDIFIGFNKEKKNFKINGKVINKLKDYISTMNIIIFCPDDLELIKGNPDIRRKYLNTEISQISSSYSKILEEYNKLLKMRNDYLSNNFNNFDKSYFEILTKYLIERLISICKYRKNYIDKINKLIPEIFNKITGISNFLLSYVPNIDVDYSNTNIDKELFQIFMENLELERTSGKTLIGPHYDDFEYILDSKNLKLYGSQGQQRMAVISLKLAEMYVIKNIKNTTPIILLDDVFSELDEIKKNNLLKYIDSDMQVIITTTDLSNIDDKIIEHAKLVKVCDGKLEEVK